MSVQQQQHSLAWSAPARAIGTPGLLYLCRAILLVIAISAVHLFWPLNMVSCERDVWNHVAVINELMKAPFDAGLSDPFGRSTGSRRPNGLTITIHGPLQRGQINCTRSL